MYRSPTKGRRVASAEVVTPERPGLCPWLPTFSQLRGYLTAIEDVPVTELENLESTLVKLRGTPQEPVSWENPETWIEERLKGDRPGARQNGSGHDPITSPIPDTFGDRESSPNATTSSKKCDKKWAVTSAGKDLLSSEFGATERGIDLQEGMGEILKIIQVKPNARRGDLLPGWRDFVVAHSNVRQESVVKHFLYNRLQSLLDRKLIERDGQRYRLTRRGEDYLGSLISGLPDSGQSRSQGTPRCGRNIQPIPAGHAPGTVGEHGPVSPSSDSSATC